VNPIAVTGNIGGKTKVSIERLDRLQGHVTCKYYIGPIGDRPVHFL